MMLGLKETVVQMAINVNGVRWYRRDDGHVLRQALEFEVKGKRKQGQPKKTWKMQVGHSNWQLRCCGHPAIHFFLSFLSCLYFQFYSFNLL